MYIIKIDALGNVDNRNLPSVKQYSLNATDLAFYLDTTWTSYAISINVLRNDNTGVSGSYALSPVLDDEGNTYYKWPITGWSTEYQGITKLSVNASETTTTGGVTTTTLIAVSDTLKFNVDYSVKPSDWSPTDSPDAYASFLAYLNEQLALKANKTYSLIWGSTSGNSCDLGTTAVSGALNVVFAPNATRVALASGDNIETITSKVAKYLGDIQEIAYSGLYSDLTGQPTSLPNPYSITIGSKTYDGSSAVSIALSDLGSLEYTGAEKTKLAGIATGAEVNVLNGVQVNGTDLTIADKKVNVIVPSKTSDLTNDSDYINSTDVSKLVKGASFSYVESTGVLTCLFTCKDNTTFSSSIDLPLENIVDPDTTYYDSTTHTLAIGFIGGGSVSIPIGDLVDLYYADEVTLTLYLDTTDNKYKFKIKDSWVSANIDTKLATNGDGKDVTVTFTQATTQTNIASGESLATLMGKLSKLYANLKPSAFNDTDTAPTNASAHLITSGGVYSALALKANTADLPTTLPCAYSLTFGSKSYDGSSNKTLLLSDIATTDTTPTESSTNLVASGGVYTQLALKEVLANKVTTIRASGTATDVAYPSEKAVRTLFDTGLIYASDFFATTYPTDQQIADNPTYYQGIVLSAYACLNWFNDKLASAGYGDMLISTFASNTGAGTATGKVNAALVADSATTAVTSSDSSKLGSQLPAYYLTYGNFTGTPSSLKNPYAFTLTLDGTSTTYDGSVAKSVSIAIPTSLKSPYALTMGSKTYDGSSAITLLASDLGISSWALASTKPSYTFNEIGSKPTTLSGYGITDAYTQTQVNSALALKVDTSPDGANALLENNKITNTYLPDFVLGQLVYGGTVDASGVATLTDNAKSKLGVSTATVTLTTSDYATYQGLYFIASAGGTIVGVSMLVGDWLVASASSWGKVDNTDAVAGVKGNAEATYRIGNVNITPANIGAYTTTETTSAITSAISTHNTSASAHTDLFATKLDASNIITASSISVATTSWASDATYADYGYKATISVSGVTTSYSAQVNFSPTEVISGIFASFTSTGAGVVYVWASEVPSSAINVDIIATKVVS